MVNFLNLETAKTPDMQVDWNGATAPLRNALAGYRDGMNQQYAETQRKEQQTYDRGRVAKSDADQQKAIWGKRALAVDQIQDPNQRKAIWGRIVTGLGSKDLTPEELDPMTGPKLMAAQAGLYNDPRDSQMKDLEIEQKRAQIGALRAKSQGGAGGGVLAQRRQMLQEMGIDENSAEGRAVLINGKLPAAAYEQLNQRQLRQTAAPKIDEGLRNLESMTKNYDDASFSNSVGPYQGATPDGLASALPINAARAFGEASNWLQGGATAPSEVRSNIHGSTEALAAAIKPLIRAPGEGVWTDQDQARLVSVVGDLAQARDKPEFKRRLMAVKDRIKANFNIDLSYGSDEPSGATGGTAQTPAKAKQMDLGDGFTVEFE